MYKESVTKTFNKPIADVWAIFSQMGCVLESLGLEKYSVSRMKENSLFRHCSFLGEKKAKKLGLLKDIGREADSAQHLSFQEKTTQWIKPSYIEIARIYNNKPYDEWHLSLHLNVAENGVDVTFNIQANPINGLTSKVQTQKVVQAQISRIEELFKSVEAYFENDRSHPFMRKHYVPLDENLEHKLFQIEKSTYGHGLARRVFDLAMNGLDSEVTNMRPHHIAQRWGRPIQEVTEVLMYATNQDILSYRWHLSCPHCGHNQQPVFSLDRVPKSANCVSCAKQFIRDFSKNVEMVFYPSPSLRSVNDGIYCFVNPSRRRRTLAYIHLEPNQELELDVPWVEGEYLSATIEQTGEEVAYNETTPKAFCLQASQGRFEDAVLENTSGKSVLINNRNVPITIAIRMPYAPQMRFTGLEAITSHAFRELCPNDVLERSDEVPLSGLTMMFTDLKDSTQTYENIGDLKAYHMVRDHFELLSNLIRAHDGALVKTIGDAIMAVFQHPRNAVEAGIAIQNEFIYFNERQKEDRKAIVKIGIHSGPCVSVLMNGRIDFFGQMVNTAARLQSQSKGEDMVISLPVVADSDVSKLLRPYEKSSETVQVKGVDEPLQFTRLNFEDGPLEEELPEEESTVISFAEFKI